MAPKIKQGPKIQIVQKWSLYLMLRNNKFTEEETKTRAPSFNFQFFCEENTSRSNLAKRKGINHQCNQKEKNDLAIFAGDIKHVQFVQIVFTVLLPVKSNTFKKSYI